MRYWLGLDLGVGSIGWAMVLLDAAGTPCRIVRMGTHLFESGTEGDVERGKDESRAGPRRMARQQRKMFRRRGLRRRKLLKVLQGAGLLPVGDVSTPEGVDRLMKGLDSALRASWEAKGVTDHRQRQLLPYRLRAAALGGRLEPFEVGRALYHLNQRRGFLSNRREQAAEPGKAAAHGKEGAKVRDDPSVVRAEIGELGRMMEAAECRTIGEYFSRLDPTGKSGERVRDRWTAREMYTFEFERIWAEQARHHPAMTDEVKKAVHHAMFFQRPLKSASHLIGRCELVKDKKRAVLGLRIAQRFRLLQRANDLLVQAPGEPERGLKREERDAIIEVLQNEGDQTFAALKKMIGLKTTTKFNFERGGEKKLPGNRTDSKLRGIFGKRWDGMNEADKDGVVDDLLSFEKPEALARRGVKRWQLDKESAKDLGELLLEPGYSAHSRRALAVLVARMEDGTPYATAKKEEFDVSGPTGAALPFLPPVADALGEVRNPAVTRALTEVRKVVNAIVRRFGRPELVRLELTRDLKRARKLRERLTKENREREGERERAAAHLLKDTTVKQPSRSDIERYLLWQECGGICPYTGRAIGLADIVGKHPQFDVEHIWPLSRSLDDGFGNKTLCYHEENRSRKKNRTPHEAYHGTAAWDEIVDRVKRFKGDAARIKLQRFVADKLPDGFAERHLAETRYISTKAAEYVGLLYGGSGGVDPEGQRRVFPVAGGLTHHLRREWMLNAILSGKDEKNRSDHRHHAVDALIVALTDTRTVQELQRAAEEASAVGRRLFAPVELPWPAFGEAVQERVGAINVSYRQSKRVSGKLHADSLYSRPIGVNKKRRIRKPVSALSDSEVERIADPHIKAEIERRLKQSGKRAKDTFKEPADHPFLTDRNGVAHPIHSVRLNVEEHPKAVGTGLRERFVTSTAGSNHHTVLIASRVPGGGTWSDNPVTLMEAYAKRADARKCIIETRRKKNTPEVLDAARKHWPDAQVHTLGVKGEPNTAVFKGKPRGEGELGFSLAANEFVQMKDDVGVQRLYRVLSISKGDIELVSHADGRDAKGRKANRVRLRSGAIKAGLMTKVAVSYLGEVRRAND